MKKHFKSRKGMSLVEVMIALAVLSLLAVPVMVAFMNTQVLARKVDKQTRISTVTRTVKQIVSDGLILNGLMIDINGDEVDADDNGIDDTFLDFVKYAVESDTLVTSKELRIKETEDINKKYKYTISSCKSYYDGTHFPDVYNVLIKIVEIDSGSIVDQIKIAVNTKQD